MLITNQSSIPIYEDMSGGFHLHASGLTYADTDRLLHSTDPWEMLAGVLLSCQRGDFAPVTRLPGMMRQDDGFMYWKAAVELLGYAGSWSVIQRLFKQFADQLDDRGTQYFLAVSPAVSCGLWAVEPLLALYRRAADEEVRYQIQRHLSYLLEEENGPLWFGPEEEKVAVDADEADIDVRVVIDVEGYMRDVRSARDAVVARVGSADVPIYEGKVVDVVATARTLYERLTSGDETKGRMYREQMLFAAATGVDCRGFFDKDHLLQYLPATAIMERFLESDTIARFSPGERYFFGHRIPGSSA